MKKKILVVDDEAKMLRVLELQLEGAGYEVTKAESAEQALELLNRSQGSPPGFSLALTDLRLPRMDGLGFLKQVRRRSPALPVIVMTAFGTIETAVAAMKAGASDYVLKPFSLDDLMMTMDKVLELHALRDENLKLKAELERRYDFDSIIGHSPKMQEVFDAARRVAPTRATVLLGGESGTGKGLLARAIHHHSPRRDAPFVKINCSAIPENLMESELFGYDKGAFTGATQAHPGQIRTGRRRDGLFGRDRGRAAAGASEAVAGAPGTGVRAARGIEDDPRRRPDHRRHQPGPARRSGARNVPRRPLLSPERRADQLAAPAGSASRTSLTCSTTS